MTIGADAPSPRVGSVARRRQADGEHRALADLAGDVEPSAVTIDNVLDDGETETGPPHGARSRRVDAIEALGQPRQVLAPDALAMVADGNGDEWRARAASIEPGGDLDRRPVVPVFDRIVEQVLENLGQLVGLAEHLR